MGEYKKFNRGRKVKGKDGQYLYSSEFYSDGSGEGFIYKNYVAFYEPWRFKNKAEVVYIPEYGFPDERFNNVPESELLSSYTRQDLIDLTGSESIAEEMFEMLAWQHPENLWNELCDFSDMDGHWIERCWAYENVYLPEFTSDTDRTGQSPVSYKEFSDVEWQDEKYRNYCLNKLLEKSIITKEDLQRIQKNLIMEENRVENLDEEIPEFYDYNKAVAESVTQEFDDFRALQMQKGKEEILNNYLQIYAYSELKRYLTSKSTMLDYEDYQSLYSERGSILSLLYDEYVKHENEHLTTDDDITKFIVNYNQRHHKNILEGEAELG